MQIRPAKFPADLTLVRFLFCEYADGLGVDLAFQNFEKELADLPGKYVQPAGGVWVAMDNDVVAGCVALRPLVAQTCEMKRLYVRPEFQGQGLGRLLAEHVLAEGTNAGYRRICLDTLPSMGAAQKLYRSLGFEEVEAYCVNPVEGAVFMARELGGSNRQYHKQRRHVASPA